MLVLIDNIPAAAVCCDPTQAAALMKDVAALLTDGWWPIIVKWFRVCAAPRAGPRVSTPCIRVHQTVSCTGPRLLPHIASVHAPLLATVQIQNFHWPHKLRILIKAIVCLFASIIIKTGTCIINFCIVHHRSLVQNICYVQNRDKYHNPRGHSKSSHIINPGSSDMEFQSIRTVICLVTTSDSSRLVPTSLT